jgi:hypothetical protein
VSGGQGHAAREAAVALGCAALGAVGWSGLAGMLLLVAPVPLLVVAAPTRALRALRALAYFAAASWPVLPAAAVFLGEADGSAGRTAPAIVLWLAMALLNVLPWMAGSARRWSGRVASLLAGLLVPALPPFSLVGLASPLASVGEILPGTGAAGLVAWTGALMAWVACGAIAPPWRAALVAALLLGSAAAHAGQVGHASSPAWLAVHTLRGAPGSRGRDVAGLELLRDRVASTTEPTLVFPESTLVAWTAATDAFLAPLWRSLAREDRRVVFGVQRPDPVSGAVDNLVLVRGAEQLEYRQHLPVPVGMYRPWTRGSVPLRPWGPYSQRLGGERVAVLICWEQLLLAPMLALAIERPTRIVAVSNLYFARGTPMARIQRAATGAWARLLGVPVVHAINE